MVLQQQQVHRYQSEDCLLAPSTLFSLTNTDAAGLLQRRSNISGWYTYHFTLQDSQLLYFELTQTKHRGLLVGTISLFRHKLTVINTLKRRRELEILDTSHKLHILRATTDAQLYQWTQLFQLARNKIPPAQPFLLPTSPSKKSQALIDRPAQTIIEPHLPVNHLVCVVHGIGVSPSILAENMRQLHESYSEIMSRVYPDLDFRIEFAVIHWRAALTSLDMHRKLQSVIPIPPHPSDVNPLRDFMVHRIVDYVYYTHARYRSHILRAIAAQLNAQVSAFRARRPDFDGKISVLGHSLGAALCYELMCRKTVDDQTLLEAEGIRLSFDAVNLFCLGNPLGTLLALDPTIGMGADMRRLPFRMYNVFKYHDPIATRLEPLVDERAVAMEPVTVPCWFNMGLRETTTQWLGGLWMGSGGRRKEEDWGIGEDVMNIGRSKDEWKWERKRMDFALQVSSTMEEVSTSWSALKSHTEYWGNRDAMLFMVCAMVKSEVGENEEEGKGVWIHGGERMELEEIVRDVLEEVVEEAVREFEGGRGGSGGWAGYLALVGLGEKGR